MQDSDSTEHAEPSDEPTTSTGDARVDAAMQRLRGLDDLPLAAQVTVFDDVHRLLQDALTGADQAGTGIPQR